MKREEDVEEGAFELEEQSISESDGEFAYDELPVETEDEQEQSDDQFETIITTQQEETNFDSKYLYRPESTDDFVRNFLVRLGMTKTLD